MWGILAGTGFEKFESVATVEELERETPFGEASSGLKRVKVGAIEAVFLPRHGKHHELLPSEVNYRANVYALKRSGVSRILCISAIGSLQEDLQPGDLVVPSQYIDRTKSLRATTFCGNGVVGHVSLAKPVCPACTQMVVNLGKTLNFKSHFDKTYVCIEGPYFSTKAESSSYRAMGAEVIGMTGFPEYALAREAGLCYLPCCFVTDYDCWDDSIPHVTLEEIIEVMRENNTKAFKAVEGILNYPDISNCDCKNEGLKTGILTPPQHLPIEKMKWLRVLRGE
jgi:5'-methylthioadenosine phosphorylase